MARLRINVIRPIEDERPVRTDGKECFRDEILGVQLTGTLEVLLARVAECAEMVESTESIAMDLVLDLRSERAIASGGEARSELAEFAHRRLAAAPDWARV